MRQWFGVSANAALNTRSTQFINHPNYKIIDSNVLDKANVAKIRTPPSVKRYFPPDEHALYKDNFAIENGELHSRPQSLHFCWSRGRRNGHLFQRHFRTRTGELSKALIKAAAPFLFANKCTSLHYQARPLEQWLSSLTYCESTLYIFRI